MTKPTEIVINNWTLIEAEGGEPLIPDLELAERLDYKAPRMIRKLVARMEAAGQLGEVCSTVEQTSEKGGRPSKVYHLTERQTLKVIARSKTEKADAILNEVIDIYMLWRKGKLTPPPAPLPPPQPSSEIQALTSMVGQLVGAVASMIPVLMQSQVQPQVYDPGFPEPRYVEPQRPLRLVERPREPDRDADPRWHWLAKVAAGLRISFEQAQKIVQIHGIPTRWAVTKQGKQATQIDDEGVREVERHARRMGLVS